MALLYDSFGVRRIQLGVNIWPDLDNFTPGQLSRLYGHLNGDDVFTSCDLRSNMGARFEGEHWVYDVSASSILLRCRGYSSTQELCQRIRTFLAGTREFLAEQRYMIFFTDEVRVFGIVPEDRERNIGEIVQKRLLARMKVEDRDAIAGLSGAGLHLVGDTEEFHWHAVIEPPHGNYGVLGLDGHLMFAPQPEPPTPGDDLDTIEEQVMAAYNFVNDDVKTFASNLFH